MSVYLLLTRTYKLFSELRGLKGRVGTVRFVGRRFAMYPGSPHGHWSRRVGPIGSAISERRGTIRVEAQCVAGHKPSLSLGTAFRRGTRNHSRPLAKARLPEPYM